MNSELIAVVGCRKLTDPDPQILRYINLTESEQDWQRASPAQRMVAISHRTDLAHCTETRYSNMRCGISLTSHRTQRRWRAAETGLTWSALTWKSPSGMCRRRLAAPDELSLTRVQLQSMTASTGRHLERSSTVGLVVFNSVGGRQPYVCTSSAYWYGYRWWAVTNEQSSSM